ncbi:hypothetical protein IJJ53_02560 [Candidatus Saccharibacteria bacterium]|nr:hypothetical protein [Candidatus Saccharibacteria bacterium]
MNKKETILWLFFGMVLGMAFIANLDSACKNIDIAIKFWPSVLMMASNLLTLVAGCVAIYRKKRALFIFIALAVALYVAVFTMNFTEKLFI